MDWNNHRREDGSIDLVDAWDSMIVKGLTRGQRAFAEHFLLNVEEVRLVKSRQVAALCIAQANALAMIADPEFDDTFKY